MIPMGATMRDRRVPCAALAVVAGIAAGGCNLIFGIEEAEGIATTTTTGEGGTTSTTVAAGGGGDGGTSSTSTGGEGGGGPSCSPYAGDGNIVWTDLGGANVPAMSMQTTDSVGARYDTDDDETIISMGASIPGYCAAGATITLSGPPVAGQIYTLVDHATFLNAAAFHQGMNAFVDTGARPENAGGTCDPPEKFHLFGTKAGVGTFTLVSIEGTTLSFTASGLEAVPVAGPNYDGVGTIGVEITGQAQCYFVD